MNTATKPRTPHPVEELREQASNVRNEKHPARNLIQDCCGVYEIRAHVEEDSATLAAMRHVKGLVAFLCTLVAKDGSIIGQGRGSAVLNENNKYITRAVASAFNSALSDAMIRATRVMDTLRTPTETAPDATEVEEAYRAKGQEDSNLATEKQRRYLQQLIMSGALEEEDRERWLSQLESLTKGEASMLIGELAG